MIPEPFDALCKNAPGGATTLMGWSDWECMYCGRTVAEHEPLADLTCTFCGMRRISTLEDGTRECEACGHLFEFEEVN
jgi:ribosomal protein L37AE/L43A